jgi:heptosyltransferase-1
MPSTPSVPTPPKRVLIVRLSAIGDVLMASPVPQAIKEVYPQATISWLVEPLSAVFVRANPYVDEVIVADQRPRWQRLWHEGHLLTLYREVRAFTRELQARAFDVTIDCQGLLKSGMLTRFSGAPCRIGYTPARERNDHFMTVLAPRPNPATRITQSSLALLEPLGIPLTPRRPVLCIPADEQAAALALLTELGWAGERFAVCCLSSSRPQKDWVWPRWAELADLLWARWGMKTVFVGGPERRVDALGLVEMSQAQPISVVGHTSLLQAAALTQAASLVVGVDTGLTYAGMATDVPTIALYGSTDPTWLTEEPSTSVCFHPFPCSPCHRRPTCQGFDCMQAITAAEVADTAGALLARIDGCARVMA